MASSSLTKAAARALLPQLRLGVATAAAPRGTASSATTKHQHGGGVIDNPPPEMEPLPADAPRQTPPRLGEADPAGPAMPTTSGDKMGGATAEGEAPEGVPDMTTPPPDVPLPPVSPDGSNV
ncbi:hypothetical protein ACP4OV_022929 [Aristida adscensionis]